jgi:hypothetical protein
MPKRKFNRIRTLVARQPKCEAIVAYGVALQPHFFDARLSAVSCCVNATISRWRARNHSRSSISMIRPKTPASFHGRADRDEDRIITMRLRCIRND